MIATSRELAVLNQVSHMLGEAKSLEEIKCVRDKAEAARNYIKAARLGLDLQNGAAEVKLRAERKAGRLLRSLKLRGGDRKSKRHDASLKLSDLGISRDQSKRWQRVASVPAKDFTRYVKETSEHGREITSAGLLRISTKGGPDSRKAHPRSKQNDDLRLVRDSTAEYLLEELVNHCQLLSSILKPDDERSTLELEPSETRISGQLLREMSTFIRQLRKAWSATNRSKA